MTSVKIFKEYKDLKDCDILEIVTSYEGFRVLLLLSDGRVVRVSFKSELAVRWMDEGSLLKTMESVDLSGGLLLELEKSSFLKWFHEETFSMHTESKNPVRHFIVATNNTIVEVLSCILPEVEVLPVDDE